MKTGVFLVMSLFFCTTVSAQDFANFAKYEKANIALKEQGIQPNTVFMGNSITEFWNDLDSTFFKKNDFVCRGISGQVTSQMLLRFREDVINLHPKRVVILGGTNDIAQNQGPISLDKVMGNIISMVQLAQANHIEVVLCSVLPAAQFPWRKRIKPIAKIKKLNRMIKAYAKAHKLPYVDYYTPMKNAQDGLKQAYTKDGVHPNAKGYAVMEKIIMKTL